jgi:hypothetical protein
VNRDDVWRAIVFAVIYGYALGGATVGLIWWLT